MTLWIRIPSSEHEPSTSKRREGHARGQHCLSTTTRSNLLPHICFFPWNHKSYRISDVGAIEYDAHETSDQSSNVTEKIPISPNCCYEAPSLDRHTYIPMIATHVPDQSIQLSNETNSIHTNTTHHHHHYFVWFLTPSIRARIESWSPR